MRILLEIVPSDKGSRYEVPNIYNGGIHKIYLDPLDLHRLPYPVSTTRQEAVENMLAHELGHFVAAVTGKREMGAGVTREESIEEEKEAWAIGEKIMPINQPFKDAALASYYGPNNFGRAAAPAWAVYDNKIPGL